MKKLFLFFIVLLFAALTASADNDSYFTIGTNGVLRIRPETEPFFALIPVHAHFEKRLDTWQANFTLPNGLSISNSYTGPGMAISYTNYFGHDTIYNASLSTTNYGLTIASHIQDFGYWDYNHDGIYESYGSIKWEPGDYDCMFYVDLCVSQGFRSGSITIEGYLSSSADYRGPTIGYAEYEKTVTVIIGYEPGDVNGDGLINTLDATMLIDYLLGALTLNEFQLAAADFNEDGVVSALDVTALIDYLNQN